MEFFQALLRRAAEPRPNLGTMDLKVGYLCWRPKVPDEPQWKALSQIVEAMGKPDGMHVLMLSGIANDGVKTQPDMVLRRLEQLALMGATISWGHLACFSVVEGLTVHEKGMGSTLFNRHVQELVLPARAGEPAWHCWNVQMQNPMAPFMDWMYTARGILLPLLASELETNPQVKVIGGLFNCSKCSISKALHEHHSKTHVTGEGDTVVLVGGKQLPLEASRPVEQKSKSTTLTFHVSVPWKIKIPAVFDISERESPSFAEEEQEGDWDNDDSESVSSAGAESDHESVFFSEQLSREIDEQFRVISQARESLDEQFRLFRERVLVDQPSEGKMPKEDAGQRYDWDGRSMSHEKFLEKYEGNGDWEWKQARPATDDIASVTSYFDQETSSKSWKALERLLFKGVGTVSTAVVFEMIVNSFYTPLRIRASYLEGKGYERTRIVTESQIGQMEATWQRWMEEEEFTIEQRKQRWKKRYNLFCLLADKHVRCMQLARLLMREGVADLRLFTRSVRALVRSKTFFRHQENHRHQEPMHQMIFQNRSPSSRRARDRSRSHRRR